MAAIIFNVLPLIPYLSVFILFSFRWVGRRGFSLLRRRPLRRSAPRRVRTRVAATKKRPTGVDRFLFYGGPSGVRTLDLGIKSRTSFDLTLGQ